ALDPQTGTGGSHFTMAPVSDSVQVEPCPRTVDDSSEPHALLDLSFLPHPRMMHPLTIALKPRNGVNEGFGANPWPSDANGTYDEHGGYTTYDLWVVTAHFYAGVNANALTGAGTRFTWSETCQAFVLRDE